MKFYSRNLQEKYEKLLHELKLKDSKLKYLSGYFETVTAKMEAVLSEIAQKEKAIKNAEERSEFVYCTSGSKV